MYIKKQFLCPLKKKVLSSKKSNQHIAHKLSYRKFGLGLSTFSPKPLF